MKTNKKILALTFLYFIVYAGSNYIALKKTFIPGPGEMFLAGIFLPLFFVIIFGISIKNTAISDLHKTLTIIVACVFHLILGIASIAYIIGIWNQI